MPANGLSDDQVAGELTKMVEFIKKEAEEKAKEIHVKANEEYEIEKASIVRAESTSIDKVYEQRYKQAKLDQQVQKSHIANKARFKVLEAQDAIINDIFEQAEKKLQDVSKDKERYQKLLEELLLEAAQMMKEKKVFARIRESDKDAAQLAISAVKDKYKEKKADIEIDIDDRHLDKNSAGGLVLFNHDKRISIDNTLGERLKLEFENTLPRARFELFGPSATRQFFD